MYDTLRRDRGLNVHGLAWTPPPLKRISPPPWTMVVRWQGGNGDGGNGDGGNGDIGNADGGKALR